MKSSKKVLKMGKESAKGSVNEIIKICVGGQDFKTTLGTLMSDRNSMLAKMFESDLLGRVATALQEILIPVRISSIGVQNTLRAF